ncbi:MAG: YraN family protein [Pyramidobacter sp.]|nr:YraN family protein [Pyramidobacter sp.]
MEKLLVPLKEKHKAFLKPAPSVGDVSGGVLSSRERALFCLKDSRAVGAWAEDTAAEFLRSQGLKILARNVRGRYYELDLVCRDARELVIVEVRCRRGGHIMSAIETLGPQKWRALARGAEMYVAEKAWTGDWRIDFVAVDVSDGRWSLNWLKYLEMDGGRRDGS